MKFSTLALAILLALPVAVSHAETPTPTATPTVTSVAPFPSTPHYLRAFPGPEEDSWYVYASGFTPREQFLIGEVACATVPCDEPIRTPVNDLVKDDGTMTFYVRLPAATNPSHERLLAVVPGTLTGTGAVQGGQPIPADAPTITVAGHNPGTGLGYPKGTLTGITAVDDVITLSQALDSAAIRSRLVFRDGTTVSGSPVTGIASWQCAPFIFSKENIQQSEYPSGLVYAVFRFPGDPDLPLRYEGASYGIAWYDGGVGTPLGGLTLVSEDGRIVGTEIRCGTTPGFHVHNFTDFVLPPFDGPPPVTPPPGPPSTGNTAAASNETTLPNLGLAVAVIVFVTGTALAFRPNREPASKR